MFQEKENGSSDSPLSATPTSHVTLKFHYTPTTLFSFLPCRWEKDEDSAMGVVTLTLPSGYEADTSELIEMNKQIGAKRIDRNDNEINIYVDKVRSMTYYYLMISNGPRTPRGTSL